MPAKSTFNLSHQSAEIKYRTVVNNYGLYWYHRHFHFRLTGQ